MSIDVRFHSRPYIFVWFICGVPPAFTAGLLFFWLTNNTNDHSIALAWTLFPVGLLGMFLFPMGWSAIVALIVSLALRNSWVLVVSMIASVISGYHWPSYCLALMSV